MNTAVPANIFSRSRSKHQIILFTIVIIKIIIFQIYFSLDKVQSLLIIGLIVWRYILILFMIYEIRKIVSNRPTDPLLVGSISSENLDHNYLFFCILCNGLVFKSSYHCFRCGQCAFQFDHHCKYLNCCIGGKNYISFLSLLAIFLLYCINVIILVLTKQLLIGWICYLGLTILLLILVFALFSFHIYLNCCLGVSTLEYLIPSRKNIQFAQQINQLKDETSDR